MCHIFDAPRLDGIDLGQGAWLNSPSQWLLKLTDLRWLGQRGKRLKHVDPHDKHFNWMVCER
jgi:hypothetical protein